MNTLETFRQAAETRKRKKEEKKHSKSPNVQNMTIGEAFRQAAKKDPNLSISRVIKKVIKIQGEERAKQKEIDQFVQLKKQLKDVGFSWFSILIGIPRDKQYDSATYYVRRDREKGWAKSLKVLENRSSEERVELLSAIASGMQITEYGVHLAYAKSLFQAIFSDPLGDLRATLSEVRFSPPSTIFMLGFSWMSSYSEQKEQEFREFIVKKSGLTGQVALPQLFPAISRWMDHAK